MKLKKEMPLILSMTVLEVWSCSQFQQTNMRSVLIRLMISLTKCTVLVWAFIQSGLRAVTPGCLSIADLPEGSIQSCNYKTVQDQYRFSTTPCVKRIPIQLRNGLKAGCTLQGTQVVTTGVQVKAVKLYSYHESFFWSTNEQSVRAEEQSTLSGCSPTSPFKSEILSSDYPQFVTDGWKKNENTTIICLKEGISVTWSADCVSTRAADGQVIENGKSINNWFTFFDPDCTASVVQVELYKYGSNILDVASGTMRKMVVDNPLSTSALVCQGVSHQMLPELEVPVQTFTYEEYKEYLRVLMLSAEISFVACLGGFAPSYVASIPGTIFYDGQVLKHQCRSVTKGELCTANGIIVAMEGGTSLTVSPAGELASGVNTTRLHVGSNTTISIEGSRLVMTQEKPYSLSEIYDNLNLPARALDMTLGELHSLIQSNVYTTRFKSVYTSQTNVSSEAKVISSSSKKSFFGGIWAGLSAGYNWLNNLLSSNLLVVGLVVVLVLWVFWPCLKSLFGIYRTVEGK